LVPKAGEAIVSSVGVVHTIEPLNSLRDPANPLEFPGGRVTPALSQSASVSAGVALFFVVYADPESVPHITVEFFQDGQAVARVKPDVGKPDELNSFPILQYAKLPAGEYLARVTVEQGGRVSRESTAVSVIP